MSFLLAVYRIATRVVEGILAPTVGMFGAGDGPWRGGFLARSPETERARGSVWVHAASLGEVVAARVWIRTLLARGATPPFLLTTRTPAGLKRARDELADAVAVRIAPHDGPGTVQRFLEAAQPRRLDLVETELWPNLLLEAGRAGIPVVIVSGTVTERTTRRLARTRLVTRALSGGNVFVLAQSRRHADRFRSLGVPDEHVRVIGDVKAEPPSPAPPRTPADSPDLILLASGRRGEEPVATAFAALSLSLGYRFIVAPRHAGDSRRFIGALKRAGHAISTRGPLEAKRETLAAWLAALTRREPGAVGVLATHGELAGLYPRTTVAVIGGTFAPYGGHSLLEAAARGCPVVIGPHDESIAASVAAVLEEEGGAAVPDSAAAAAYARFLCENPQARSEAVEGAMRAASRSAEAAGLGVNALEAWGLLG